MPLVDRQDAVFAKERSAKSLTDLVVAAIARRVREEVPHFICARAIVRDAVRSAPEASDMNTNSRCCRSGVTSGRLRLRTDQCRARRTRKEDVHGDSPTTLEYQSNCPLAHVVLPAAQAVPASRRVGTQSSRKALAPNQPILERATVARRAADQIVRATPQQEAGREWLGREMVTESCGHANGRGRWCS